MNGIILCGGQSRRMGAQDKALVMLDSQRLVDRVLQRFAPQVDQLAFAGRDDYGTGSPVLADDGDFQGPAAGIFGALSWLKARGEGPQGFVTVPVDGPNIPLDLVKRLSQQPETSAIASDETGIHPTFAYWCLDGLQKARQTLHDDGVKAPSLRHLARAADAIEVNWSSSNSFININTPQDLATARLG